jgi:V-type H+-transporting ATPase subunit E
MIKLLEPELLIKCRREDVAMIKELISEIEVEFKEIMKREVADGDKYSTRLKLLENDFLTPEQGGECGGVVMTSVDRRIVCNNTLKSRLDLCFEELLPHIRKILFPAKVVPPTPESVRSPEGRQSEAVDSKKSTPSHK